MILKFIPPSNEDVAVHQLPESDMAVDPRAMLHMAIDPNVKFEVAVNGAALTITRINRNENEDPGWHRHIRFRVYKRDEFHYSFESTTYLYHCIYRECAPRDATEIVIKDGVERIGEDAFRCCRSLSKITIPNTVESIGYYSFNHCESLQFIQLPPNLRYIAEFAFSGCLSLEAIYIPPTVTRILSYAFDSCRSIRIINIPENVQFVGDNAVRGCDDLITDEAKGFTTHQEYYQWLRSRYNPLHNLCWDPSVTANNIQRYIQQHHDDEERATTNDKPQFTALHLLAANPFITGDMVTVYLQLAPDVATMLDNKKKTPLHMLCSAPSFVEGTSGAIEAYLGGCNEGSEAAFMKDDEGRTPFDYLCERDVDELLFLENKSFAGLMVWWYDHCLDISLFENDIDAKESRKRKALAYDDSERRQS